jgi:hypothetical protein
MGSHSSLGDYIFEIQHFNKEENVLISGTRGESAVADSAELKQEGNFSAGRLLFPLRQHFCGRGYFIRHQRF